MIARLATKGRTRALVAGACLFFASMTLIGCDTDGYPSDLVYPARTDALVIGRASRDALGFDTPGEYPRILFVGLPEEDRAKLLGDPSRVKPEMRAELEKLLNELFGTPAEPRVTGRGDAAATVQGLSDLLHLNEKTLALGIGATAAQARPHG